jgi:hypothetical protein
MRLIFLLLGLSNIAVFAWFSGVGWFGAARGALPEAGREPERISQQIEPDRIRALTPPEVQQLRDKTREVPKASAPEAPVAAQPVAAQADPSGAEAPATGQNKPVGVETVAACTEFGDFSGDALVRRARERLARLKLGKRLTERTVEAPGYYMVFIPPLPDRAQVDARAEELRQADVREMLVITDNSTMRFGISLGSFRDRDLAVKHQADLARRGITDVKVADTPSVSSATRFTIRDADAATQRELAAAQKEFPQQRVQRCGPAGRASG